GVRVRAKSGGERAMADTEGVADAGAVSGTEGGKHRGVSSGCRDAAASGRCLAPAARHGLLVQHNKYD
ncbi:MAG: hypothetical protein LBL06_00605, partial [Treponema sp.]|nr:hypothetical protein [Treponema sp.]